MTPRSEQDVLRHLRERGARRLRRVSFRRNRSTIWSLTRGGTALNLHAAYREAPEEILDAFAVVARHGGRGGGAVGEAVDRAVDRAVETVRSWPGLREAIRRVRTEHARRRGRNGRRRGVVRCAGTPEQGAWLRAVYAHYNRTRFGGRLPDGLPVRFSRRMRSSLGHMRPGGGRSGGGGPEAPGGGDGHGDGHGERHAVEIALNLDLVLPGNEEELLDTLVHEMAHAADWLFDGERGHGASWRRWAERAGCAVRTRHHGGFRRRRRRGDAVTRVPPLPEEMAAAEAVP